MIAKIILAIRSLLFTTVFFASAIIASILVLLSFWAPFKLRWAITVAWGHFCLWAGKFFCGLNVVVEGRENIPVEPSVVMIKHTTAFETYWQLTEFPRAAWVIKRELLWIPFFGWAVALMMQPIAVNRRAGGPAVKQVISQGCERLANGVWVTVFPEGTRMPPGETRRYGISGAALAREAGCKIVPVAHNAGDFWKRRSFYKRPGTVRFVIGPPIDPAGLPPKEVNLHVQAWVEAQMCRISSEYKS